MKRVLLWTIGLLALGFIGLLVAAPVVTCSGGAKPHAYRNACINNLRQIDGAKEQWGIETKRTKGEPPKSDEIAQYIKGSKIPRCPKGGSYTLGNVGETPQCPVGGHTIQ